MNQPQPCQFDSTLKSRILSDSIDYFSNDGVAGPIAAINELLHNWLLTPGRDMSQHENQTILFDTKLLINYLTKHGEDVRILAEINSAPEPTPCIVSDKPKPVKPSAISEGTAVKLDKDVYQYHIELLDVVSDFFSLTQNPIEALNHITVEWLTQKTNITHDSYEFPRLLRLLSLTTFLSELKDKSDNIFAHRDYLGQVKKS